MRVDGTPKGHKGGSRTGVSRYVGSRTGPSASSKVQKFVRGKRLRRNVEYATVDSSYLKVGEGHYPIKNRWVRRLRSVKLVRRMGRSPTVTLH